MTVATRKTTREALGALLTAALITNATPDLVDHVYDYPNDDIDASKKNVTIASTGTGLTGAALGDNQPAAFGNVRRPFYDFMIMLFVPRTSAPQTNADDLDTISQAIYAALDDNTDIVLDLTEPSRATPEAVKGQPVWFETFAVRVYEYS